VTWIKLSTGFFTHPKVLQAGERAAWIYIRGLCYAVEHDTDGVLTEAALRELMPRLKRRTTTVERLCESGLWTVQEPYGDRGATVRSPWCDRSATVRSSEIVIHDFKDWQRTKPENPAYSRENGSNGGVDLAHLRAGARAQTDAGARAGGRSQEQKRVENPPPTPPLGGNRVREQQAYRRGCEAYAAEWFPELPNGGMAVHQAIYYAKAHTFDDVQAFVAAYWTTP
jgi:hypothetical protein